jgi:hypothetical protein
VSASDVTEPRRGWPSVYALSFGLLLAAGVTLTVATLGSLNSLRLLRVSAVLSVVAIVVAVVSVVVPRRS